MINYHDAAIQNMRRCSISYIHDPQLGMRGFLITGLKNVHQQVTQGKRQMHTAKHDNDFCLLFDSSYSLFGKHH